MTNGIRPSRAATLSFETALRDTPRLRRLSLARKTALLERLAQTQWGKQPRRRLEMVGTLGQLMPGPRAGKAETALRLRHVSGLMDLLFGDHPPQVAHDPDQEDLCASLQADVTARTVDVSTKMATLLACLASGGGTEAEQGANLGDLILGLSDDTDSPAAPAAPTAAPCAQERKDLQEAQMRLVIALTAAAGVCG